MGYWKLVSRLASNFKMLMLLLVCVAYNSVLGEKCCGECQCDPPVINCDSKSLTEIPSNCNAGSAYTTMILSNNRIKSINDSTNVPPSINTLVMSHNNISSFSLSHNAIRILDLSYNLLSSVPGMAGIPNLKDLDVSRNPVNPQSGFNVNVMRDLGAKLQKFHLGDLNVFNIFPKTASDHLQNLDTIEINGASPAFQYLPPNAFHAFEARLVNLTIRNTQLQAVPLTLRDVPNLEEFHFDNNPVGDYGILPESFTGLNKLTILSLRNDEIKTFPEIVDHITNLKSLNLDNNYLQFIRENAFDMVNRSKIEHLSLRNCSLNRIPGAISNPAANYLQNIKTLDFSDNNIQSVDRDDIQDLKSLQTLSIADNPLEYISSDAFRNLPNLKFLDLSNTYLDHVPLAVENLDHALNINIDKSRVACTCDLVNVALYSERHSVHFNGSCETIDRTVEEYLNEFAGDSSKCPPV